MTLDVDVITRTKKLVKRNPQVVPAGAATNCEIEKEKWSHAPHDGSMTSHTVQQQQQKMRPVENAARDLSCIRKKENLEKYSENVVWNVKRW